MLARIAVAAAALATARAGSVDRVVYRESDMVRVDGGTFAMGMSASEREVQALLADCAAEFGDLAEMYCKPEYFIDPAQPRHTVYLPGFEIDRYEVTVAEYRACAAAGGCDVAALVSGDSRYVADDALPMVNVTWQDAVDYCAWEGKRLPTEAEWEKAARGTDGRRWPWGNQQRADGANHGAVDIELLRGPAWGSAQYISDDSDGYATAVPPGTLAWSDGPYGAYDMAGNVSEWVADYFASGYGPCDSDARQAIGGCVERGRIDPVVDAPPAGVASLRVYRGGSWAEPKLFGRTYFRLYADPEQRAFDRGFRCARDLPDSTESEPAGE